MKTKPAAKPKTTTQQPTADTMTTTTQQAAEPPPAYAFSIFAKNRPALQEIAELTGESFEGLKQPDSGFSMLRALLQLDGLPKPPPLPEIAFTHHTIKPLMEQVANPDLDIEQRREIQRRIIEIKEAPFAPIREHHARIERLKIEHQQALTDFEEWVNTDPAGISARAADEAHSEWIKADQERRDAEAKEAERQARAEKLRRDRQSEADWLACEEIGAALDETNIEHPDIDSQTYKDFITWQAGNDCDTTYERGHRPLNAILTGPPGVGKSRALAAAAIAECKESGRDRLEWITGYEFAQCVSDLATDKRDESTARLQAITETATLYFDDLGSANFTPARTSRFFRLIDERYRRKLPTYFSTNYSTPQLKKVFTATGDSKDEAVRILRRIIGTPSEPLARFFQFQRPQK